MDTSREQFEHEYWNEYGEFSDSNKQDIFRMANGKYLRIGTRMAWWAWRKSREVMEISKLKEEKEGVAGQDYQQVMNCWCGEYPVIFNMIRACHIYCNGHEIVAATNYRSAASEWNSRITSKGEDYARIHSARNK